MVGERIRQVREALGLTRAHVVQSLAQAGQPVTEAQFAAYEEGARLPPIDFLVALAPVLGVTPALVMERASLARLPRVTPPAGYRIRPYQEGDAAAWCQLTHEIGGAYDEAGFVEYQLVQRGIGEWPPPGTPYSPDGLYFAERAGRVVGTACAVWRADAAEEKGYVHMVVVAPEHRGRGLGHALVVAALRHLRARGFRRAALETDDHRLPAIRLYLRLGFQPQCTDETHRARWAEVKRQL